MRLAAVLVLLAAPALAQDLKVENARAQIEQIMASQRSRQEANEKLLARSCAPPTSRAVCSAASETLRRSEEVVRQKEVDAIAGLQREVAAAEAIAVRCNARAATAKAATVAQPEAKEKVEAIAKTGTGERAPSKGRLVPVDWVPPAVHHMWTPADNDPCRQ